MNRKKIVIDALEALACRDRFDIKHYEEMFIENGYQLNDTDLSWLNFHRTRCNKINSMLTDLMQGKDLFKNENQE